VAKKGDIINNSITKEKMLFLKTAADTDGQLLEIEMTVGPGGFVAGEHLHPELEERFQILAGKIDLSIDGRREIVAAGEERVVPKNTRHVWKNGSNEELKVILQFRPAGTMEYFLESVFALAEAGKTNAQGLPHPLQVAVLFREFRGDMKVPNPFLDFLLKILAPFGHLLGYPAHVYFSPSSPSRQALRQPPAGWR
jgi:quercetin dioxygenase-like cupin family protein